MMKYYVTSKESQIFHLYLFTVIWNITYYNWYDNPHDLLSLFGICIQERSISTSTDRYNWHNRIHNSILRLLWSSQRKSLHDNDGKSVKNLNEIE